MQKTVIVDSNFNSITLILTKSIKRCFEKLLKLRRDGHTVNILGIRSNWLFSAMLEQCDHTR